MTKRQKYGTHESQKQTIQELVYEPLRYVIGIILKLSLVYFQYINAVLSYQKRISFFNSYIFLLNQLDNIEKKEKGN